MKKNIKSSIAISSITVLVLAGIISFNTGASDGNLLSRGRIEFTNSTETVEDDVVFDAEDLVTLDNRITTGKEMIANALNSFPNQSFGPLDTFEAYANGINSITSFAGDYYYDKATEGDGCVRYIKEGESYFPCDVYGNKTSETPLGGTITIVTKEDTSTPVAGEVQLVKYAAVNDANISAGAAGFIDHNLILGSGSDNINYRNLGYALGYAEAKGETSSFLIEYEHHFHTGSATTGGGCYTNYGYHVHSGSSSTGGGCYTKAVVCGAMPYQIYKYCSIYGTGNTGCYVADHSGIPSCGNSACPQHTSACQPSYECRVCGFNIGTYKACPKVIRYDLTCGKTSSTIEGYTPSCGYIDGELISAKITYTK